ncbi:MAG: hypothetical protein IID39_01465 [Planctomycetes bacterium]|nr:hypothetical protein [Planctomycetota bacterium]
MEAIEKPDESSPTLASTTEHGATVAGRVTVKSKRRLPQTVLYIEPVDPVRRFQPPANEIVVSQRGAKFSPSLLVISVGQTVEFRNDENRPIEHNVFSRSPTAPFDLGLYRPGISKPVTFDKPGVVRLYCSIHRYMDGLIYVCPTPFFARVDDDGHYKIEDVPAGEYYLKTWQQRQRYAEQSKRILVQEDTLLNVDFELIRK